MNLFLSTSLKKHVDERFIGGADSMISEVNNLRVMFEIEANPHLPGEVKPFARFDSFDNLQGEDETSKFIKVKRKECQQNQYEIGFFQLHAD